MDTPPSFVKRDTVDYARTSFEEVARQRDSDLDVALGAALVARDVYPQVDVAGLIDELDRFAVPLFGARLEHRPPEDQARALGDLLYGSLGFRGNEAEYYDPRNSLLSDVLERRLGIPLTLAIVYCEVARRVGVPAKGVGFPGHFLVRIDPPGRGRPALVVDPFFGGRVLGDDELRGRLRRTFGKEQPVDLEPHLAVAAPRSILVRMLTNLKAIYLTRGERARAHLALDRIASLLPYAAGPLVERGQLAAQLGARESARSDLNRALTLHPDDGEERAIHAALAKLGEARSALN